MNPTSAAHKEHALSSQSRLRAADRGIGLCLLRLCAGGFLLPHGLGKLFGWFDGPGLAGFASQLQHFGIPSGAPIPLLLASLQTALGLCVAIGLWTRLAATWAALLLAATVVLNTPNGWFWMHGGIEYPLLWTIALVATALLGAGPLSVDGWRRAATHIGDIR